MPFVVDFDAKPSLPQVFFSAAEAKPDTGFLYAKSDGEWVGQSYAQVAVKIRAIANALRHKGIESGDRVALVAENRPDWVIAHLGVLAAGAVSVPTYTTNTITDHIHIFGNSGAKAVFVSTAALAKRVIPAALQCDCVETVIGFDGNFEAQNLTTCSLSDLISQGQALETQIADKVMDETDSNGLAVIIYTSGTGGAPKGVMLSHNAVMLNAQGAFVVLRDGYGIDDEVFLSFLPLSHSYEHMAGLVFPMCVAASVYYAESVEKLLTNMGEVRPTVMTAVPRLFEAMRLRILQGLKSAPKLRQRLFWKAVELGTKQIQTPEKMGLLDKITDLVLEKLVRTKVRNRFGGRLKALVSGGAALTPEIGLFFQALGLELLQGYGQTEAAPLISVNRPNSIKMDTVGTACFGVEIKIAEDGEILARGENLMLGYWDMPDASAKTIVDGWLHTGDVGSLDDQGRLKITDRKKDIIVLSGGDNISPAKVEGLLTMEPEIGQAMVIGDKRPHLAALLVPNEEFLAQWCKENNKTNAMQSLQSDADLAKVLKSAIDRANKGMSQLEKVRKFKIAREAFTTDNAQMTASMKIRRHVIKEEYEQELASMY